MTIKDTAVTFYLLGLVSGMIVAFASCSIDQTGGYQQHRGQVSQPVSAAVR